MIWAGQRGQPTRLPEGQAGLRILYLWVLLFLFGGPVLGILLMMPESRLYTLGAAVLIVAAFLHYRRNNKRPSIFLTDRRLVDRSLWGTTVASLAEIVSYRRVIARYYYRGTTSEVATNKIALRLQGGPVRSIGPVHDYDDLTAFLDGVISRDIDPTRMRGLDGEPATAEQREDLFVAVQNQSEGEAYGPLIIGPRGMVRFTQQLPIALEGQLLTTLAQPDSAEELEGHVVFLSRRPGAGHVLLVDLSSAELDLKGTSLRVKSKGLTVDIQLAAADAPRAQRFLQASRVGATPV